MIGHKTFLLWRIKTTVFGCNEIIINKVKNLNANEIN